MVRKGFTLIELLIVVSIIAVLAGLLFPALSMVKKQVNVVKCSSNLRQIALAIEVYRQQNEDRFPYFLMSGHAGDPGTANLMAMDMPAKIFQCPFDKTHGQTKTMGRRTTGGWTDLSFIHEPGSSYCFESSSFQDKSYCPDTGDGKPVIGWFYSASDPDRPTEGHTSWAEVKQHQQKVGNLGGAFPPDYFPVVRCYWHHDWNTPDMANSAKASQRVKVNNISLGFNVFQSSPFWEHDVNPNIPLPP
jgi:prepilin-type N-terminal cleavage/methylation domain-containing protein